MDYHGLSWIIMDYHGLSWIIMDYHGLSYHERGISFLANQYVMEFQKVRLAAKILI